MKGRKTPSSASSEEQRAKISAAMKRKWQDENYRNKALKGMEKYRDSLPPKIQKTRPPKSAKVDEIVAVTPMKKLKKKKRKANQVTVSSATAGVTKKKKKKKKAVKKKTVAAKSAVSLAKTASKKNGPEAEVESSEKELRDDGDISRMRTERRDLYDLLYGDEGDSHEEDVETMSQIPGVLDLDLLKEEVDDMPSTDGPKGLSSFFTGTADLNDDDLDDYDPYNLDDY